MIETSEKQKLDSVMEKIRATSFSEKQEEKTEEELMDSFLDAINSFKKNLDPRTAAINEIAEGMEELTWLKNIDQPTLQSLNELIVLAKDVQHTLIRHYVRMSIFIHKGIAKNEITEFKRAIDFLKESYSDLEAAFFIFPKQSEFVETTAAFEQLV